MFDGRCFVRLDSRIKHVWCGHAYHACLAACIHCLIGVWSNMFQPFGHSLQHQHIWSPNNVWWCLVAKHFPFGQALRTQYFIKFLTLMHSTVLFWSCPNLSGVVNTRWSIRLNFISIYVMNINLESLCAQIHNEQPKDIILPGYKFNVKKLRRQF